MRPLRYFVFLGLMALFAMLVFAPQGAQALSGSGGGSGGSSVTTLTGISPVPTAVATTTALDLSQGINRALTLNGTASALSFTNPTAGITYKFEMIQGSGGSHTVAWPGSMNWAGGTTGGGGAPTLSTAAATIDIIMCYYDGTYYNCDIEKGFVP